MAKKTAGAICATGGMLLLAAALLLSFAAFREEAQGAASVSQRAEQLRAAMASREDGASGGEGQQEPAGGSPGTPNVQGSLWEETQIVEIQGIEYEGLLEIPSLGLSLPVIRQWSAPNLKLAPCRYSGSAQEEGFVIAGHNYQAHFGPLHNLVGGEQVRFTDISGVVYTYEVAGLETLAPTAVEEMLSDAWDLTLFTCDFTGQARLAVRCVKVP